MNEKYSAAVQAAIEEASLQPGATYLELRHEAHCPNVGMAPAGSCTACTAVVVVYKDDSRAAQTAAGMAQNRAQRRAAERQARAAIRRARNGSAKK